MTAVEQHAKSIFFAALEHDPDHWREFVNESSGDNTDLRERVNQLLQAHQSMGSIHEGTPAAKESIREGPGAVIGAFKLLEQIGEGGFGIVYMAEQTVPVRRKVALKILKAGMDTRQVVARFEAERQALAMMDHPNIARVLDAGETANGRPYFAMELVGGVPITQFCDDNRLPSRQRLELFVAVCQAVQHAHQKGVIHRDIKPSNVLVALHDGVPVPKVIDFGIAKAIGERLTDKTLFTNFAQMIGTPTYMSPEQAQIGGLDIDTRSDIYSLGVLLYELLTGTTPFDKERLRTASFDEIRRIIREEEPLKPSSRISTLGQAASTISTQRSSDPHKLTRLFRHELDWIVMKALDKDRNRRFESASTFAADVQRYLKNEPVLACPPSSLYRFRKFARRNKIAMLLAISAILVLVLLVCTLSVTTWLVTREQVRTKQALAEAKANYETAEALRRRAQENFEHVYAGSNPLVRLGTPGLDDSPDLKDVRKEMLEETLKFFQGYPLTWSDDPADRYDAGLVLMRIAALQERLGRPNEAEEAGWRALEIAERLDAEFPTEPKYRRLVESLHQWAGPFLWKTQGRPREAELHLRRVIAYWESPEATISSGRSVSSSEPPSDAIRWRVLAGTHNNLGRLLQELPGRGEDAAKHLQQATAFQEKLVALIPEEKTQRTTQLNWLHDLAYHLWDAEHISEAEETYRQALAVADGFTTKWPRDPTGYYWTSRVLNSLGLLLRLDDRPKEAVDAHRRAIDIFNAHLEKGVANKEFSGEKGRAQFHRGLALSLLGEREAALADLRVYLASIVEAKTVKVTDSERQTSLANIHQAIGRVLERAGNVQEAEQSFRAAVDYADKQVADFPNLFRGHFARITSYFALARFLAASDRVDEAESFISGITAWTPSSGQGCNSLAWRLATCSEPHWCSPDRALELATKAVELMPDQGAHWITLGVARYRTSDARGAIASLQKSQQLLGDNKLGSNLFFLAMARWQLGEKEQAQSDYAAAVEWMEKRRPKDEELIRFRKEAAELMGLK